MINDPTFVLSCAQGVAQHWNYDETLNRGGKTVTVDAFRSVTPYNPFWSN
jgi:hypothetical protein